LVDANKNLLNCELGTDVVFKYDYQSVDGFTRAFKNWSGFLTSDVIKKGISKSYPKLSFIITVKEGTSMEYRIEDKPAFNLVGLRKRVTMQFKGDNQETEKLAESKI